MLSFLRTLMKRAVTEVTQARGEGRGSLHSHLQSCCPAPGALSGAPPPESAALRSAAGSALKIDKGATRGQEQKRDDSAAKN